MSWLTDIKDKLRCLNHRVTELEDGGGSSFDPASPGPIGQTTPDSGNFTGLTISGTSTFGPLSAFSYSGTSATAHRTSLGGTIVGQNLFGLANPSAVTFPRFNADNTVTALSAPLTRSALGIHPVVKTSGYTAVNGESIDADTAAGAWTLTLPASPSAGAIVTLYNTKATWGTNNLTIGRNGSTINGSAADFMLRKPYTRVVLIYSGSTWQIMLASPQVDIQVFASSGTYYKPPGAYDYEVLMVGGGGGGGGGRCDIAGTDRYGGGGGSGAGMILGYGQCSALGATESVTVGAAGTGGVGRNTVANGGTGASGGTSIFGPFSANGGNAGSGGTSAAGTAGSGTANRSGAFPLFNQSLLTGGAGSNVAGSSASNSATSSLSTGGGGGGGLDSANTQRAGGAGGAIGGVVTMASVTGGAGGAVGANGSAGNSSGFWAASGGGGGGSSAAGSAGAGGAGAAFGAGGGGGGASVSGQQSGAGGDGGPGIVVVTTYCSL